MVDVLTTKQDNFFQGIRASDYLKNEIVPGIEKEQIRIWSAGCSSGEEPYSIAILYVKPSRYRKN